MTEKEMAIKQQIEESNKRAVRALSVPYAERIVQELK